MAFDVRDDEPGSTVLERPKVNLNIRQYFEQSPQPQELNEWLCQSEVPKSSEVLDNNWDGSPEPNKKMGAWQSKDQYLSTLYDLLREDAVGPIRKAVSLVRSSPNSNEIAFAQSRIQTGIYDKVRICGVTLSTRGIAIKVTFSLVRIGKKIAWEQSKRLLPGTLVVLTPKSNIFESIAIVATVAARPLTGLQQNPPEIDLFFARSQELEIDPAVEYLMVEERSSLYEAQRHTLCALQHMKHEDTPFLEHLVDVKSSVTAPAYVQASPTIDLASVFGVEDRPEGQPQMQRRFVHILNEWPVEESTSLDTSQSEALKRALTKRFAIIQGPPGTGKTYVSVAAIKCMLANFKPGDPPIIIACQTNHAIDQILRHIAEFEDDFVRLGGMSKDRSVIKRRTLFEMQWNESRQRPTGSLVGNAMKSIKALQRSIQLVLEDLKPSDKLLDHRKLEEVGILTKAQADSLEAGVKKWVSNTQDYDDDSSSPFILWLGDQLLAVPYKQMEEDYGFEFEEADNGYERIKEVEAEFFERDEGEIDKLQGPLIALADNFTSRKVPGQRTNFKTGMLEQDLWKVPVTRRGAFYRHLQTEFKKRLRDIVRKKAEEFEKLVSKRRIGRWEEQECILREQKVIGMTTTGLSKNRAMLAALKPKIVLIEEAAEILEPPVTAACLPSVEHLILVGDHKQLRPQTSLIPLGLHISLFERMLENKVEFSMLKKQRRMIPEIRRLLYPIYENEVEDHDCVNDRKNVPGMGGINSYFFTHKWPEQRDELMSAYNAKEAEMVAFFFEYLCYNGVDPNNITVLSFYHGQRKRIIKELHKSNFLMQIAREPKFNVVTVDSYQGDENEIVILSLARSNTRRDIGFLNVDNRVCVALSRARNGFYIFGDHETLSLSKSKTWRSVIDIMQGKEKRVLPQVELPRLSEELPLRCQNHQNKLVARGPDDFAKRLGGCMDPCQGKLHCGCPCPNPCHVILHDLLPCPNCDVVDTFERVGHSGSSRRIVEGGPGARSMAELSQRSLQLENEPTSQHLGQAQDEPLTVSPEILIDPIVDRDVPPSQHSQLDVFGEDLMTFETGILIESSSNAYRNRLLDEACPCLIPESRIFPTCRSKQNEGTAGLESQLQEMNLLD